MDPSVVATSAPFGIEVAAIVTVVALMLGFIGRRLAEAQPVASEPRIAATTDE